VYACACVGVRVCGNECVCVLERITTDHRPIQAEGNDDD